MERQIPGSRSTRRAGIVLAVLAVLVGACGGDPATDASDGASTIPPSEQTTAPTAATTTPPATSADGATVTIVPPLDLAGTSWTITHYTESTGAFTNTLDDDATLVFGDDGTLSGTTGCNEFAGTWEITGPYTDYDEAAESFEDAIDGQPITISVEPTTSVECDGFLGDQDTDLLADLAGSELWFIGSTFGDETAGITLLGQSTRVFADPA